MRALDLAELAADTGLTDAQIYVQELPRAGGADPRTGLPHTWRLDDGRTIYPASMIKVPLAVAAAVAIERGGLRWETPVGIDARNATLNDAPSPLVPGYRATVRELIVLMLQRSDNVATNQLYDLLGRERATADVAALGFPGTAFRRKLSGSLPLIDDPEATGRNAFSCEQAAAVFAALAADRVPQATALRAILAAPWWNTKLPKGLAEGDAFAHKTGDTDEVSHDGGILTLSDSSRWIVVVYTELPGGGENDHRFGALMRALRAHMTVISNGATPR